MAVAMQGDDVDPLVQDRASPAVGKCCRLRSCASRCSGGMIASPRCCPTASLVAHPNVRSACSFQSVMRPVAYHPDEGVERRFDNLAMAPARFQFQRLQRNRRSASAVTVSQAR